MIRSGARTSVLLRAVALSLALALAVANVSLAQSQPSSERIDRALNDVRAAYFFEDPALIDWAAVALLSERYGCQVTLARLRSGEIVSVKRQRAERAEIALAEITLPAQRFDTLAPSLTGVAFPPDIIIFGAGLRDDIWSALQDYYNTPSPQSDGALAEVLGVRKVYRALPSAGGSVVHGAIVNQRELLTQYAEVIRRAASALFPGRRVDLQPADDQLFSRYELVRYEIVKSFRESDFLSGLSTLRLEALIERALPESAARSSHLSLARQFQRDFDAARSAPSPKRRVDLLVSGFRALSRLAELSAERAGDEIGAAYHAYLSDLAARAQRTTLAEMGLDWEGEIIVRESPQGPRVKFRTRVTVSGPLGVNIARVLYYPESATAPVVVDSLPKRISPHQQFVREYLVPVERLAVSEGAADSLRFAVEIRYSGIALLARSSAGVRGSRSLQVAFEPDFRFIPKVANVLVDKTVAPFYWKAVVNKPRYYSGGVDIELKTPPGIAAGAMERTLTLRAGEESETIQFPLVAGTSLADGISRLIVTLSERGQALAVDTALIRVANCEIDPKRAIGFVPDTSGALEDVLRMTTADATALTDRALEVGDLSAYQTVILGSGCLRTHPALLKVRERISRFVRQGGLLLILGQPEDWPPEALPVRITPTPARLEGANWEVSERAHRVFSTPYTIYTRRLTETVGSQELAVPAVIEQGKKLITDQRGRVLLTAINMGEGQIIYCGFPLLARIGALEINAIHLLANLVSQ